MNLQEFAALKVGDEIENALTHSTAKVAELKDSGVVLHWGGNPMPFTYAVGSTAWFHWKKVERVADDAS